MANRWIPHFVHFFSLATVILVRQALGGPLVFRAEFVIEDFILLLTLAAEIVRPRFKPLIWRAIASLTSITMTVIALVICAGKFSFMLFALLAIYSAVQILIELSKIRRSGPVRV